MAKITMKKVNSTIKNFLLFPCLLIVFASILLAVIITNRIIEYIKMERSKLWEINKVLVDAINKMLDTGSLK